MIKKIFLVVPVFLISFLMISDDNQVHSKISHYPVMVTGMTYSLSNFDDGYYKTGIKSSEPRFIDNKDGTVTDNFTGLMWLKDIQFCGKANAWKEAINICSKLHYAGHNDWRLPSKNELSSLQSITYRLSNTNNKFDTLPKNNPFKNIHPPLSEDEAILLWTSNYIKWHFNPSSSYIEGWRSSLYGNRSFDNFSEDRSTFVWPVRTAVLNKFPEDESEHFEIAKALVEGQGKNLLDSKDYKLKKEAYYKLRFTDNHNGTVTDNRTGLMWVKDIGLTYLPWKEALLYCNKLNYAGKKDWRLPNLKELESIIDYYSEGETILPPPFVWHNPKEHSSGFIYTSTPTPLANMWNIYTINFRVGAISQANCNTYGFIWPVRGYTTQK
ncbi:MAG TPA: hypothetical protein DD381_14260 [Lentisphaeria bacterium]|nr:MAG: hypothetical protein A2X47_01005 [Lentisphaerae bacterium GWF2_38_69]HBM17488.1 hypothetical protein [Lentisphaeria bacterium]